MKPLVFQQGVLVKVRVPSLSPAHRMTLSESTENRMMI